MNNERNTIHARLPLGLLAAGFLLAGALVARETSAANANPPDRLSYQGFLVDANGGTVASNAPQNYTMIFRIWAEQSGGSAAKWTEEQVVTVDRGNFSVILGEGVTVGANPRPALSTVFTGADASDRYLETTVKLLGGSDVTIAPRIRLLPGGYAFSAQNALQLVSTNGVTLMSSTGSVVVIPGMVRASNFVGQVTVTNSTFGGSVTGLFSGVATGAFSGVALGVFTGRVTGTAGSFFTSPLGVGTSLPAFQLDVAATNAAGDGIRLNSRGGPVAFLLHSNGVDRGGLALASSVGNYSAVARPGDVVLRSFSNLIIQTGSGSGGIVVDTANRVALGTNAVSSAGEKLNVTGEGRTPLSVEGRSPIDTMIGLYNRASTSSWQFVHTGPSSPDGRGKLQISAGLQPGSVTNTVMTLTPGGKVGIGTVDPTQAKLVVIGTTGGAGFDIGQFKYFTDQLGITDSGSGGITIRNDLSIYANEAIAGLQFFAHSDARIKNVTGVSDSAHDLETLSALEVTDYTFRDVVTKGRGPQKKLIAQQVEKVYPQAVNQMTDVVPDIYKLAAIKDGWISLATDLAIGERVRLIAEEGQGEYEVLETRADGFRTALVSAGSQVFVFGRQVGDFRSLDYEAISMLNVSATQELTKRLAAAQAEVEALKARLAELEALVRGK